MFIKKQPSKCLVMAWKLLQFLAACAHFGFLACQFTFRLSISILLMSTITYQVLLGLLFHIQLLTHTQLLELFKLFTQYYLLTAPDLRE